MHTYKVVTRGNGSLYGWTEFDEKGDIVRESEQSWPTEADAEKAIRTVAPLSDLVEVISVKNINEDGNHNVVIVRKNVELETNFGMKAVEVSITGTPAADVGPSNESANVNVDEVHTNESLDLPHFAKEEEFKAEQIDLATKRADAQAKSAEQDAEDTSDDSSTDKPAKRGRPKSE